MDESTGSHQAEETVEVQSTESTVADTVTTQEEAPTGIKIKYNGADEVVSYDEAPTWIQKGKNYDKVQEKATQLESQVKYLERRAKQEGFADVDSYVKAIDEYEKQQAVEQEANKYGVPEEFIRQELQPLKSELDSLKAEREQFKQAEAHRQIDSEVAELSKNNPDFESMKDEVFNFAIQNNIKLEHAYKLLTYDAKIETAVKTREQEVLARVTGRDGKQVLPSVDSPNNMQVDPANMSDAEIQAISARVRRGERITLS